MESKVQDGVRRLLYAKNINQSELARLSNVSRSTLTRWFSGHGDLLTDSFLRILKELAIDINRILSDRLVETLGAQAPPNFSESVTRAILSLDPLIRKSILLILIRELDDVDAFQSERVVLSEVIRELDVNRHART